MQAVISSGLYISPAQNNDLLLSFANRCYTHSEFINNETMRFSWVINRSRHAQWLTSDKALIKRNKKGKKKESRNNTRKDNSRARKWLTVHIFSDAPMHLGCTSGKACSTVVVYSLLRLRTRCKIYITTFSAITKSNSHRSQLMFLETRENGWVARRRVLNTLYTERKLLGACITIYSYREIITTNYGQGNDFFQWILL